MKLTNIGVQLLPVTLTVTSGVYYAMGSIPFAVACLVMSLVTFTMLLNDGSNNPE